MSDTKDFEDRFDEFVAADAPAKTEPAPIAQAHTPDEPAAPPTGEVAAAEELFPGYSALPEAARAKIDEIVSQRDTESQARIRFEAEAKQAALEAKRYRNQLTPVRQKLTKLEQERSAHVPIAAAPQAPQTASRAERLKAELPDEYEAFAELADAHVAPLKAELEAVKSTLSEAQERQLRADVMEELSSVDPDWVKKTSSKDFIEWRDAISNPDSEFYEKRVADAIADAKKLDADAAVFVLRLFNRDLADYEASLTATTSTPTAAPLTVAKPTPDPSTRRGVMPPAAQARPRDEFDRRYTEYLARNP